jgi:hypothetical protein
MHLDGQEFIRRILLHVLPPGFQRIHHYGLLGNRHRAAKLSRCRALLATPAPMPPQEEPLPDYRDRYQRLTGVTIRNCPNCRPRPDVLRRVFPYRARSRAGLRIGTMEPDLHALWRISRVRLRSDGGPLPQSVQLRGDAISSSLARSAGSPSHPPSTRAGSTHKHSQQEIRN